ncbi:MAG: lipoprotein [Rhizobiaceae bacterium]
MIKIPAILLVLCLAAASLSACGRRGPLEAPSAAANPTSAGEKAVETQAEDKRFILDGLIQ